MTQQTIEYAILYGAIGSLVTAVVFLYRRTVRMEARLMAQLKSESERCEKEKVRMFAFIISLQTYISALAKTACPIDECPIRRSGHNMPPASASDMGLGDT